MGWGAHTGDPHHQRDATRGGSAPASLCSTAGTRSVVDYQADYIFWKAV